MYTLANNVSTADTDYGTVLLDEASGRFWNLNPSGALVLREMLNSGSVEAAATALANEYAVERHVAEDDARAVVRQLLAARVLVREAPV